MITRTIRVIVVSALAAATAAGAQEQPAFKAGVELVRIPVNLTQGNKPVAPGLVTAADFTVIENGVRQPIALFDRESRPISLCVVFDTSGSMGEGLIPKFAVTALRQVLTRLLPDDEVAIVAFAAESAVATSWTPAPALLALPINLETRGATSLNDAIVKALEVLDDARHARPVMLVITDGFENSSRTSLARTVTTRRQSETLIYAFDLGAAAVAQRPVPRSSGPDVMAEAPGRTASAMPMAAMPANSDVLPALAEESGGVIYKVKDLMDAAALARVFVEDLRFQYVIGYTPLKPPDGKYRRVKVEMNKRGFKIRHRGGYLAMPGNP